MIPTDVYVIQVTQDLTVHKVKQKQYMYDITGRKNVIHLIFIIFENFIWVLETFQILMNVQHHLPVTPMLHVSTTMAVSTVSAMKVFFL